MQETWARSLGREDPLEKEMATHSSILAWRIPSTEEPGGLQSTGSQRVGQNWATSLAHFMKCERPIKNCSPMIKLLFLILLFISGFKQIHCDGPCSNFLHISCAWIFWVSRSVGLYFSSNWRTLWLLFIWLFFAVSPPFSFHLETPVT